MKSLEQQINNMNLDALKLENEDLVPYIKENPDMLSLAMDYLDINQKNILLEYFCGLGDLDSVKDLVANGADLYDDECPLLRAVENGHVETVKYLVSKGISVNAYHGYPLDTAVENGDLEMVKCLVSEGALDLHEDFGQLLYSAVFEGHLEIFKFLFAKAPQTSIYSADFFLETAAREGQLEIVKYLVSQGADIHTDDDEPLRGAEECGHSHIVDYLTSLA